MAAKDYYKILGIQKNATPEDIKKAFRKLALQYHPDKNKGDKVAEEKFKAVNEANRVLIDPEKRKLYDRYGEDWEQVQQGGPAGRPGGQAGRQRPGGQQPPFTFESSDFENDERFEDLFSQFFGGSMGGRSRGPRVRNGGDIEAEVQITLEDAFSGMSKMLSIGTEEQYRLTLKKGVREGQQFRLRGKGKPGQNGGKNGDLLLNVRIAAHTRYTRTGNDLRCKQLVDLVTAVLGGKTRVQTMHGEKIMTLQPGTQNGAVLRMRGLGMPVYDSMDKYGDLYVEVLVDIPRQLSPAEHELYSQLAKLKHPENEG